MQKPDIGSNPSSPKRPRVNLLVLMFVLAAVACVLAVIIDPDATMRRERPFDAPVEGPEEVAGDDTRYAQLRREMVERLKKQGITDERVLRAMKRVGRHEFVPEGQRRAAYLDRALPIEHGQTISQPFVVAMMTQLVNAHPHARALDIGTGTGYQAAILAELVKEVHSVEIICELADSARARLQRQGYINVDVTCGDGYQGIPNEAPFDVILVAAAADHIPQPLIDQLAPGGRLIMPVGDQNQQLQLIIKSNEGIITKKNIEAVRFVPMTGQAQDQPD